MSLSFVSKSAVFLVLALLSSLAGREYAGPLTAYLSEVRDITAREARISKRSLAYRIPADAPLEFVFSQPVSKAKVLIHPSVSEELRDLEGGFVYGLRIRWLTANGEEISTHQAYLQADSPDAVFTSGQIWRFFRTRPELVAEQDQLVVESARPASRLQLEVFDVDQGIVGVDARVFEQLSFLGNQSLSAYRRLNDGARARLAAPNAFPADMLTPEEQAAYGRHHWRSVGPVGLDGRDFTMLVLYEALREDLLADQGGGGL